MHSRYIALFSAYYTLHRQIHIYLQFFVFMRYKDILRQSLLEISEDTKLVRLATITTFVHSLLFIVYILYVIITLSEEVWADTWFSDIISDFSSILDGSGTIIIVLIVLAIVLAIWYLILPPIWDAAMINYVSSVQKSWSTSLWSWISRFFPMMEFNATLGFINLIARAFAVSRLYVLWILNNWLTITLVVLWFIVIMIALIMLPYTKMIITIEDKNYFDAMKESCSDVWL